MKWLLWPLLLLAFSVQAATPHLDIELTLDPATRKFQAKADLTTTGPLNLALDPLFHVSSVTVNGVRLPVANAAAPDLAAATLKARGAAPQRLTMAYSGTLPAIPARASRPARPIPPRSSPRPRAVTCRPARSGIPIPVFRSPTA